MLQAAAQSAGILPLLDRIISVDDVQVFKPSPRVYALAPERLGAPAAELGFVSSNAWDVAGAKAFGYRVAWCNRLGAPEEQLGVRADWVITTLADLPR
jgi:2-haloacid dehalogenase